MWRGVRDLLFPVACSGCATPGAVLCPACAPTPADTRYVGLPALSVTAAGMYAGALQRAIVRMKYGERAALDALAPLVARLVPAGVTLVPVPTSRARRARRGFDQAEELARRAARERGLALDDVLVAGGPAQHGRGRGRRLAARGRYALRRPVLRHAGAAFLIDDVCTTGATLLDAAAALRGGGIDVAGAAVVAWTAPRGTIRISLRSSPTEP